MKINQQSLNDIPSTTWDILASKRIFFGHQSVGFNILDGIADIMNENPHINLNIVETSSTKELNNGFFAHDRVGKNKDPKSKIEAFRSIFDNGIGDTTNIAFFKFCYVDIVKDTDINDLFNEYSKTLTQLKTRYPTTTFIHCTTPLTSIQTGIKAFIKNILGKPIPGHDDNITRNKFNNLLRKEYSGKEPLFDLAQFESTLPNGNRTSFEDNGTTYYYLAHKYTTDGGHLNTIGRKIVAEQLLICLSNYIN